MIHLMPVWLALWYDIVPYILAHDVSLRVNDGRTILSKPRVSICMTYYLHDMIGTYRVPLVGIPELVKE